MRRRSYARPRAPRAVRTEPATIQPPPRCRSPQAVSGRPSASWATASARARGPRSQGPSAPRSTMSSSAPTAARQPPSRPVRRRAGSWPRHGAGRRAPRGETGRQQQPRAREDGEQSPHAGRGVGLGIGSRQRLQCLYVEDRVEPEAGREGAHRLVLADRGAVGEPFIAHGPAESGRQHEAAAVGVPPQGEDGPGGADGECRGPAGEHAIDRFRAVLPGLSLGNQQAPPGPRSGEHHPLAQQRSGRADGLGAGPAQQEGAGGADRALTRRAAVPRRAGGSRHGATLGRFAHLGAAMAPERVS